MAAVSSPPTTNTSRRGQLLLRTVLMISGISVSSLNVREPRLVRATGYLKASYLLQK